MRFALNSHVVRVVATVTALVVLVVGLALSKNHNDGLQRALTDAKSTAEALRFALEKMTAERDDIALRAANQDAQLKVYRTNAVEQDAIPDGFPASDEFALIVPACRVMTARIVCGEVVDPGSGKDKCKTADRESLRYAITRHCKTRAKYGSNNGAYRSKVPGGGQIHDRDRPAGWIMYKRAVKAGWLLPDSCSWHELDQNKGHDIMEHMWAVDWPFTSSPLSAATLRKWISEDHDTERFVARGPIDNVPAYTWHHLPDRCFDPAQFDRNDVSVWTHTLRALKICAKAAADGLVCTYQYLRCTWGNRGKKRCAERVEE